MRNNAFISAAALLAVAPIFVFFAFEAGLAHADGNVATISSIWWRDDFPDFPDV